MLAVRIGGKGDLYFPHENWQTTSDVCAAVTVVYVVVKTVRITQAGVSIPQTTAWANEKIFLIAVTIFLVTQKIV